MYKREVAFIVIFSSPGPDSDSVYSSVAQCHICYSWTDIRQYSSQAFRGNDPAAVQGRTLDDQESMAGTNASLPLC